MRGRGGLGSSVIRVVEHRSLRRRSQGVQRAPYAVVGALVLNHTGNWPLWDLDILDGLPAAECCGR